MQHYEVANHEPGLLPEGKRFRLVWSDEFGGDTLDRTKRDYRTAMMGKVHPARTNDGVTLDGKEDGKITEDISGHEEFVLISTEVKGYRLPKHVPCKEAFDAIGDTFLADYVRVFDIKEDKV